MLPLAPCSGVSAGCTELHGVSHSMLCMLQHHLFFMPELCRGATLDSDRRLDNTLVTIIRLSVETSQARLSVARRTCSELDGQQHIATSCVIFSFQVEAYPNMVEPYVEALRYLTPLGFDVLTFTIIDRLAGSGASCPSAPE